MPKPPPEAEYRVEIGPEKPFRTAVPGRFENTVLPTDSQERKGIPVMSGCFDYFPAALAEVARVSQAGNDKHNPGEPLHHARGKSMDHADCALRHLMERGKIDEAWGDKKIRHTAEAAWRVLALLQEEMEAEGAPLARGAVAADPIGDAHCWEPDTEYSGEQCLAVANNGCLCTLGAGHREPWHIADGCGEPAYSWTTSANPVTYHEVSAPSVR